MHIHLLLLLLLLLLLFLLHAAACCLPPKCLFGCLLFFYLSPQLRCMLEQQQLLHLEELEATLRRMPGAAKP